MIRVILFSKDRAFQLDGTLRSFQRHCSDWRPAQLSVIYRCSSPMHQLQYQALQHEHSVVSFIQEQDFRSQLMNLLDSKYTLFLVDDNIFVRGFSLTQMQRSMDASPTALGFSLRLGRNTTYCYSLDRPQELPELSLVNAESNPKIYSYRWPGASHDFGYALEVSSSLYRSNFLRPYLTPHGFSQPNALEALLMGAAERCAQTDPLLLCFEQSVTFCNPVNKVQVVAPNNRAGVQVSTGTGELSDLFERGARLDIASYDGFIPRSCHQEVILRSQGERPRIAVTEHPMIAVIIPCYRQAHLLPEALQSVVSQSYPHWQCVVVNDGSPDETSSVAREFIAHNPGKRILLLEKDNEGLAEARNSGIAATAGEWILPLDSDDGFAPNMMERTLQKAREHHGTNHVSVFVQEFGARSNILQVFPFSRTLILQNNMFPYASLYQRVLWERHGGYQPIIPFGAEDWNFWVTCSRSLNPQRIEEPLFRYRKHQNASMVDAVVAHQKEVESCLHSIHPDLYEGGQLLEDHEVIAAMQPDTRQVLDRHIAKFPQYSSLYLWRGLHHEQLGSWRQAIRDFTTAAVLCRKDDWQPWFRLALLWSEKGEAKKAKDAAQETLQRAPYFPLAQQLRTLINS